MAWPRMGTRPESTVVGERLETRKQQDKGLIYVLVDILGHVT
jgi:hypothetical protein